MGASSSASMAFMGLGTMGSELARRLLAAGHRLTVWNRTPAAAMRLAKAGALIANENDRGVTAAELIFVCVTDAQASHELLLTHEVGANALRGRTVAVLSTMSDSESRALARALSDAGARYLCGTILGYPANVREGDCTVAFAGDRDAWRGYASILRVLGGRAEYLGADPGATALFDRAVYAAHYGALVTFIQGAAMARAAGLPMDLYLREATSGQLDAGYYARQIERGEYPPDEAAMHIEAAAYADVPDVLAGLGLDSDIADAIKRLFDRGLAAGLGAEGVAALAEMLGAHKP